MKIKIWKCIKTGMTSGINNEVPLLMINGSFIVVFPHELRQKHELRCIKLILIRSSHTSSTYK